MRKNRKKNAALYCNISKFFHYLFCISSNTFLQTDVPQFSLTQSFDNNVLAIHNIEKTHFSMSFINKCKFMQIFHSIPHIFCSFRFKCLYVLLISNGHIDTYTIHSYYNLNENSQTKLYRILNFDRHHVKYSFHFLLSIRNACHYCA